MRLLFRYLLTAILFVTSLEAAIADEIEGDREQILDELHEQLKNSTFENYVEIESRIIDIWNHSGSPSMDFLFERGQQAAVDEDYPKALEHLSSLIDHAPDFTEGWNTRATVYYFMGEYSLSVSDIRQTLILNPRHFGALSGLGLILEEIGSYEAAYKAYKMAQKIHPFLKTVNESLPNLSQYVDGTEL